MPNDDYSDPNWGLPTPRGAAGQISPGNIDLNNRPRVRNADGSTSTVRSMSFNMDGREILVPTVSEDGRIMSEAEAIDQYRRTGRNLGIFDSPQNATAYAEQLHQDQARQIEPEGNEADYADPNWGAPAPEMPSYAGVPSELRAGEPESAWHSAWQSVSDAIFGSRERREFEAENGTVPGSQPTSATMARTAWQGAAMLGGPTAALGALPEGAMAARAVQWALTHPSAVNAAFGAIPGIADQSVEGAVLGALAGGALGAAPGASRALGAGGGAAPGIARRVAASVARNPVKVSAALGAVPGIRRGNPVQALEGAALSAVAARVARGGGRAPRAGAKATQEELDTFAREISAPATSRTPFPERGLPPPPVIPPIPGRTAAPAAPAATPATTTPASVPAARAAAAPTVDPGRAAASSHKALMTFAKQVAKDDPKVGEKIWILLDKAGAPIKRLTPDQAGAANRAGQPTTWVKNLW